MMNNGCGQNSLVCVKIESTTAPAPTTTPAPDSDPRTSDWGRPEYEHCVQPYTWSEIIRGSKDMVKTGGLGNLVEVNGYETWQCIGDHPCAWEFSTDPQDSWFCFVYHEPNGVFIPWGPNSLLKLL